MGKSSISMAIFQFAMLIYQRLHWVFVVEWIWMEKWLSEWTNTSAIAHLHHLPQESHSSFGESAVCVCLLLGFCIRQKPRQRLDIDGRFNVEKYHCRGVTIAATGIELFLCLPASFNLFSLEAKADSKGKMGPRNTGWLTQANPAEMKHKWDT